MIKLQDIRYVRLGTGDLDSADRFVRQFLGLELARADAARRYYRSDHREHTLVYFDGDARDQTTGFELATAAELDAAHSALSRSGIDVRPGRADECDERGVRDFINFRDPSGNSIDLVVLDCASAVSGSTAETPTGFSHVGLCSTDPLRDEQFWTTMLGARVSDRIGEAPLLRIDQMHHKIALFPAKRAGVQHVNHQLASIDDVMRAWYTLRRKGVRIVFGPGRHPPSNAVFLYFEGPDRMIYEYSTGVRTIAPEAEASHVPRCFPFSPDSLCMWGAVPDITEFRASE